MSINARIHRVLQQLQQGRVIRVYHLKRQAIAGGGPRQLVLLVPQPSQQLAHTGTRREFFEHPRDRLLHAAVGMLTQVFPVHHDVTTLHPVMQFPTQRFLTQRGSQPLPDGIDFMHGQRPLNSQHQAVLRQGRIEHLSLIAQQRTVQGAPMRHQGPVERVARQPRGVLSEHDPDLLALHALQHFLEALAIAGEAGAGALITLNDPNLVLGPAERQGPATSPFWTR